MGMAPCIVLGVASFSWNSSARWNPAAGSQCISPAHDKIRPVQYLQKATSREATVREGDGPASSYPWPARYGRPDPK